MSSLGPNDGTVTTPYASFESMSREIKANGGSWYINSADGSTIAPHQSMGGATDLIALKWNMRAQIDVPSDIAKKGDNVA